MHLAIGGKKAAVCINHGHGVIEAGLVLLEDRNYYHYGKLFGQSGKGLCGRTGNGLSYSSGIFLIPLGKVARAEKLLQADDLRAFACGLFYLFHGSFQVEIEILGDRGLNQSNCNFFLWHALSP